MNFGLTPQQVELLKVSGLKPEEIAGEDGKQQERVSELLHWFVRLANRRANPKWCQEHAMELAYYIATMGLNRNIDVARIRRKGFIEGVKLSDSERATVLEILKEQAQ